MKNRLGAFVVLGTLLLGLSSISFGLHFGEQPLRDADLFVKTQFEAGFSPAISDNLIRSGLIRTIYQAGEPDIKRLDNPSELELEQAKLPSSQLLAGAPIVKFVHSLFNMVPRDTERLAVSTSNNLFASHIRDSTIGILLDEIMVRPTQGQKWNKAKTLKRIQDDLYREKEAQDFFARALAGKELKFEKCTGLTVEKDSFKSFDDVYEFAVDLDKIVSGKLSSSCKKAAALDIALEPCKEDVKKNHAQIDSIGAQYELLNKAFRKEFNLPESTSLHDCCDFLKTVNREATSESNAYRAEPFLGLLEKAMGIKFGERDTSKVNPKALEVSKYLPLQLLLSRALLESKSPRTTLVNIWREAPGLLVPEFLKDGKLNEELAKKFQNETLSIMPPNTEEPSERGDPELTAIRKSHYAEKYRLPRAFQRGLLGDGSFKELMSRLKTPLFNQSLENTPFRVGKTGPLVKSSDCCEATYLNLFLNFIRFNPTHDVKLPNGMSSVAYNFDLVEKEILSKKGISFDPELKTLLNRGQVGHISTKDQDFRRDLKEVFSNRNVYDGESNPTGLRFAQKYGPDQASHGKSYFYDMYPDLNTFAGLVESFLVGMPKGKKLSVTERINNICELFGCKAVIEPAQEPAPGQPWNKVKLRLTPGPNWIDKKKPDFKELVLNIDSRHCFAERESTEGHKRSEDIHLDHSEELREGKECMVSS